MQSEEAPAANKVPWESQERCWIQSIFHFSGCNWSNGWKRSCNHEDNMVSSTKRLSLNRYLEKITIEYFCNVKYLESLVEIVVRHLKKNKASIWILIIKLYLQCTTYVPSKIAWIKLDSGFQRFQLMNLWPNEGTISFHSIGVLGRQCPSNTMQSSDVFQNGTSDLRNHHSIS